MTSEKNLTPWGARIMLLLAGRPLAWLARESGLGARNMSDIINKTMPSADRAVRIAKALGTTVEYLITGEGPGSGDLRSVAEPAGAFQQPTDRQTKRVVSRYQMAQMDLEEATQAAAVIPDEVLKQVLTSLLFRYEIPVEEIVLILAAKARKVTP